MPCVHRGSAPGRGVETGKMGADAAQIDKPVDGSKQVIHGDVILVWSRTIGQTLAEPRSSWQDRSCVSFGTGGEHADLFAQAGDDHAEDSGGDPGERRAGVVERFNGRIEDVLQSHRFRSGEDLEQTILRYVRLYNGQLPQSVLKGRTPIGALKDWHHRRPELFKKRPYNHAGCDKSPAPGPRLDKRRSA